MCTVQLHVTNIKTEVQFNKFTPIDTVNTSSRFSNEIIRFPCNINTYSLIRFPCIINNYSLIRFPCIINTYSLITHFIKRPLHFFKII